MPRPTLLRPYWTSPDSKSVRLYHGDVRKVLRRMPSRTVQTVVTSPPYWNLRDYGADKQYEIGCEETPQEFVDTLVDVFEEVWRVLRDDGTLWLNLGDSIYEKNLTGTPWRTALAMQDAGWILRNDIIWVKKSPMPESCRDRCSKAHEYVFLFAKQGDYYYDQDAIREPYKGIKEGQTTRKVVDHRSGSVGHLRSAKNHHVRTADGAAYREVELGAGANKRDVWILGTETYGGDHFATFPKKLVEPCILAGTSEKGACVKCGAPWRRITDVERLKRKRPRDYVKRTGQKGTGNSCANSVAGVRVKTLGWEQTCDCKTKKTVPCTVLDPFVGSATTCLVALMHGRRSVGIDLHDEYLQENAIPRIQGMLLDQGEEIGETRKVAVGGKI